MTRVGYLSTYPPTRCGLATFTESLSEAVSTRPGDQPVIVRVLAKGEMSRPDDDVAGRMVAGDPRSISDTAAVLNDCAAVVIQHEFGIYGGRDGSEVVRLLDALTVPSIVVLHTVLPMPTAHQRSVLETVCARANVVVVMTEHARVTLLGSHAVSPHKVHVIPHGARTHAAIDHTATGSAAPRLLTWGLISPGKGLEWGIRAVADLEESGTRVDYVIAGQTHPKLVAREGEAYRYSLIALVDELSLADRVSFVGHYLDAPALDALVDDATIVVLPYESLDQATSGVLAEAVAARVPVVATDFPHAVELLSDGAGIVVPHRDPAAIADGVRTILSHPGVLGPPHPTGGRTTEDLSWTAVGASYAALIAQLVADRAA